MLVGQEAEVNKKTIVYGDHLMAKIEKNFQFDAQPTASVW
jgi:hypothetical protein